MSLSELVVDRFGCTEPAAFGEAEAVRVRKMVVSFQVDKKRPTQMLRGPDWL